jgi:hypothetical protein
VRWVLSSLASVAVLAAADPAFTRAIQKLDLISQQKAKRGSVVVFTPEEINAWARVRVPEIVPEGIRDQRVDLGTDTASGYALVDFLKMRQAGGAQTNWLMARMIQGERPLKVFVRLASAHGRCTVYLTRVELSGVSASGSALDFLVNTFFLPLYPDAKINESFDLDYNIERIEIRPAGVRVVIQR